MLLFRLVCKPKRKRNVIAGHVNEIKWLGFVRIGFLSTSGRSVNLLFLFKKFQYPVFIMVIYLISLTHINFILHFNLSFQFIVCDIFHIPRHKNIIIAEFVVATENCKEIILSSGLDVTLSYSRGTIVRGSHIHIKNNQLIDSVF